MRLLIAFVVGIYVGQEYGRLLPNVRNKTMEIFEELKNTDLYKKVREDVKRG
jgi:uncharacterized membrane-anchored protein YhcB (DUF1043 family)